MVTITHPFHPLKGTRILLTTRRENWGEDRVIFYDAQGRLTSLLASWTDIDPGDSFAQASGGRSWFRTDDLRHLRAMVDDLLEKGGPDVKQTLPQL